MDLKRQDIFLNKQKIQEEKERLFLRIKELESKIEKHPALPLEIIEHNIIKVELLKEVIKICTDQKKINLALKEIRDLKVENRKNKEHLERARDAEKRNLKNKTKILKVSKKKKFYLKLFLKNK